jgi:hypothetical protein
MKPMLTELEWKCLWSIADDYEEVPQVKLMLKNQAATDISARDISICLQKLVSCGLAVAYEFDESKWEYARVDFHGAKALLPSAPLTWRPGESSNSRLWFCITKAGKDLLKDRRAPWLEN